MSGQPPRASFRLILGAVVGLILALVLPRDWPLVARILVGWTVFCTVNLARLIPMLRMSAEWKGGRRECVLQ